jgi:hypothetical protein
MRKNFTIFISAIVLATGAYAQVIQQTVTTDSDSGSGVTTIINTQPTPGTTVTRTTTVTMPASRKVKTVDGANIEIDSDSSVYKLYDDGARTAADDGIHNLNDGTVITVKDGKLIP